VGAVLSLTSAVLPSGPTGTALDSKLVTGLFALFPSTTSQFLSENFAEPPDAVLYNPLTLNLIVELAEQTEEYNPQILGQVFATMGIEDRAFSV
jgi:hypothetical protein